MKKDASLIPSGEFAVASPLRNSSNTQLAADQYNQAVLDLTMPRNRRLFSIAWIDVYVVTAPMPPQIASLIGLIGQVANQRAAFQPACTCTSVELNADTGSGGAPSIMSR